MEPSADLSSTPSINTGRSASSPTIFTPSSTSHSTKQLSTLYPSHCIPSTTIDQDLDFSPNSYPFGSARSSISNGIRIEPSEQGPPLDFSLDLEGGRTSGSGSSGSGVDEFGGFFNDFERYTGSASSTSSASLLDNPTAPSSSLPPTSTLPLPSPPLAKPVEPPRPVGSTAWESENPFASEGLLKGEGGGGIKPSVGFTIIKSLDETRTPQACQACRSRKSKCDGQASCIRCVNRGIQCVYITRSPRVRGKRPDGNARSFSSSSTSSHITNDAFPLQSTPSKSVIAKSERGIGSSRRQSSDGEWEGGIQGWGNEVESESMGARREVVVGTQHSYQHIAEEARRRRPSTDPYPSPRAPIPFGSHHLSTPSTYNYSRSSTSRSSIPTPYPTSYDDRTFQPLPHQHVQHRHSIAHFPPPLTPTYTPTFHHQGQFESPIDSYSPFSAQPPLQYSPTLGGTQPLIVDQSDASPFVIGSFTSTHTPYPHPPADYHTQPPSPQPYYQQPHQRQSSFPSVRDPPSSDSHLGLYPQASSLAREESRSYVEAPGLPTPAQPVWEEDNWGGLGYSG